MEPAVRFTISYCLEGPVWLATPHPRYLWASWEAHYLICFRSASLEATPLHNDFSEPAWRFSTSLGFRSASLEATPHHDDFSEPAWRFSTSHCFRSASLEATPHHWEIMVVWSILLTLPLYLPPYTWNLLRGSLHHIIVFVLEGPAGRPLLIIFPFRASSEALHITYCFRRAGRPLLINFHSVPAGNLCTTPIVLEVPAWRLLLFTFFGS